MRFSEVMGIIEKEDTPIGAMFISVINGSTDSFFSVIKSKFAGDEWRLEFSRNGKFVDSQDAFINGESVWVRAI